MRGTAFLLALLLASAVLADGLFNEQGYRSENYRRATPEQAPAGQIVTTGQLKQMIDTGSPVLIDVQAVSVRPETADFDFAWLPSTTRYHIPGSTWLPNVGYGELEPRMLAYLRDNLERLTLGDKSRPVVIYCVVDCWMSWNAVRRAAALGYRNLYWYPQGTDGWQEAGLPTVAAEPYPLRPRQFFRDSASLDLPRLLQEAGASERDLLIFFGSEHCPFCRRMHAGVLVDPEVIDQLEQGFIAIAVDIESSDGMVDALGRAITQREFSQQTGRIVRTPTLVFYDADFNMLHRHSGLVATRGEMLRLLDFVRLRAYENESWKTYRSGR